MRSRPRLATALAAVAVLAASASTVQASAAPNAANCSLAVPANPLSATGLATPYRLHGCKEADSATTAFVQAAVIAPGGAVSVYPPLVVSGDDGPVVAPVVPVLPPGATVGIWFGFNGNDLHLVGPGAASCVNGEPGSVFGQFAYCNAVAFFAAANVAIAAGRLKVPPLGTAADGTPCPTVRSFAVVDQDQSDNVQTQYLEGPAGDTIQDTAANHASHSTWVVVSNPSDNRLLTAFVDPAVGCSAWSAPNLADGGAPVNALALDELQAAASQAAPKAYVPLGDPMTSVNGHEDATKTTLYRAGVDQPAVSSVAHGTDGPYCDNLASVFPAWMKANRSRLQAAPSPVPAAGANLWDFLGGRFVDTYEHLMARPCPALTGKADPVAVTVDASGAVVAVRFPG